VIAGAIYFAIVQPYKVKLSELQATNKVLIAENNQLKTELTTEKEKPPIVIPVKSDAETIVKYVERPADSMAQVKVDTIAPKIVVQANEKEYSFDSIMNEKYAFEKGQLQIQQSSAVVIDTTKIINDQMQEERLKLKRQEDRRTKQHAFWGIVTGAAIGYAVK
jgi:hypothetical protein